ncbi:hypothetical protein HYE82_34355 [Streptomyces sp. BR123]|uniref:hypothetical protein n=1 Tax=Streptomyces sp. BR123 TaxID=2749828 RepID=UPI0015C4642C|nr:hypothetical protein [Streptomyces sp. BR123]NXY99370.1 hypothetical protein [Streptomyces sp. BR123]
MIQMVWHEVRGKLSSHPVTWLLLSIVTAVLMTAALLVGALAGWGGLDIGETCGDSFDEAFRAEHLNDPPFPLHNWCNSEHDLVPSWVNPTVTGLAAVSAACLVMSAVLGMTRANRKRKRKEQTV